MGLRSSQSTAAATGTIQLLSRLNWVSALAMNLQYDGQGAVLDDVVVVASIPTRAATTWSIAQIQERPHFNLQDQASWIRCRIRLTVHQIALAALETS